MYEPGFTWATGYSDTYSSLSMAETASKTQSKTKTHKILLVSKVLMVRESTEF